MHPRSFHAPPNVKSWLHACTNFPVLGFSRFAVRLLVDGVCSEMSELLFECYCVPRVAYGIDALFSYRYNAKPPSDYDALIVACGYQGTHVLPVIGGRLCAPSSQRIDVGGAAVDGFMQRVMQLKYPQHFSSLSLNRAEV